MRWWIWEILWIESCDNVKKRKKRFKWKEFAGVIREEAKFWKKSPKGLFGTLNDVYIKTKIYKKIFKVISFLRRPWVVHKQKHSKLFVLLAKKKLPKNLPKFYWLKWKSIDVKRRTIKQLIIQNFV